MRKAIFVMMLLLVFSLSGCASVISLTTEEEDMIAEYVAQSVVHMYLKSKGLLPDKSTETVTGTEGVQQETLPTVPDNTNETSSAQEGNTEQSTSVEQKEDNISAKELQQALNITGVELAEMGYFVADKYPMEEFLFTVEATKGKKLLVVEYDVWNSVDAEAVMEMQTDNVKVRARINGEETVNMYKTLLNTDIFNMNGKQFAAGEAKTGALIFLIDEELSDKIKTVELVYAKSNKTTGEETQAETMSETTESVSEAQSEAATEKSFEEQKETATENVVN